MSNELPAGWAMKSVGEIATITMGQSPPSSVVSDDGDGLPFIQGNAEFGARYPKPRQFAAECPKVVEAGDILLSVRAPVGEVNVAPTKLCIGRGLAGLRPTNGDFDFLYFALSGLAPVFSRLSQGSTFDAINGKDLRSIPIHLPPLDEQRWIAEVLRSVDQAIAAAQQTLEFCADLLVTKRRHTFKRLIVEPEDDAVRLGDICELGRGFAFKSEDYVEEGLLNFRVTNVGKPASDLGEQRFLPSSFRDEYEEYVLTGGEIVLVMVGATVGKLGRVPKGICPALLNQNMWTLTAKKPFDQDLLWHLAHVLIEEKVHGAQGGAYSFLTKKDFLEHRISRFDVADIAEAVANLTAMEQYAQRLSDEVRQFHNLKASVMSDLLSGRVRVPA